MKNTVSPEIKGRVHNKRQKNVPLLGGMCVIFNGKWFECIQLHLLRFNCVNCAIYHLPSYDSKRVKPKLHTPSILCGLFDEALFFLLNISSSFPAWTIFFRFFVGSPITTVPVIWFLPGRNVASATTFFVLHTSGKCSHTKMTVFLRLVHWQKDRWIYENLANDDILSVHYDTTFCLHKMQ